MPRLSDDAKEQRRQTLIDAAWRCIARQGYRNLSVDDICAEASLSKGAFYTYFDQKSEVLLALLEDDAAGLEEVVASAGHESVGVEQLRRIVSGLLVRGADAAAAQLRADLWAEISADPALRARLLETVQARRRQVAALIESEVAKGTLVDVPANAFAAVLLALGDGLMLHRALDPSGFRWSNVRRAVEVILTGLDPGSAR